MNRQKQKSSKGSVITGVTLSSSRSYTLERIIRHREEIGLGGSIEYEVKWLDYAEEHNTWEPPYSLIQCPEAISEYWAHQESLQKYDSRKRRKETYKSKKEAAQKFQQLKDALSTILRESSGK